MYAYHVHLSKRRALCDQGVGDGHANHSNIIVIPTLMVGRVSSKEMFAKKYFEVVPV